ncbi:MAG TPA: alpha/beta hydrolase [Burkholderiales bacterium]|nr:alpha/beta hydrolase [Burkholderiales bacterium]
MHLLEAGDPARPCVLLLHGFPELAYSWREVMPRLAAAGYYVVAPDQRGFGATTGWDAAALESFAFANLVADLVALLGQLSIKSVHLAGHDFGSPLAGAFALLRPDLVRSVAFMSAPFGGAQPAVSRAGADLHADLARLDPPRKHYQWYFSGPGANRDMMGCAQGLRAFLRAYFHMKSAGWAEDRPFALKAWTAEEMARLPRYYVMDLDRTMPETVRGADPGVSPRWLTDEDLSVYEAAFGRTSFEGGLNWYRCATGGLSAASMQSVVGRAIEQPACFIAGEADWGTHQKPGELERMQNGACRNFRALHLVPGAGHWVQQEQPEATARLLLDFLQ